MNDLRKGDLKVAGFVLNERWLWMFRLAGFWYLMFLLPASLLIIGLTTVAGGPTIPWLLTVAGAGGVVTVLAMCIYWGENRRQFEE